MSRPRTLFVALMAAAALSLTACSTGSADGDEAPDSKAVTEPDANAFPVTVEHAYGESTIESEPQRVVTLGWTDQDTALSLGVVPIGATDISWGGNEHGSTPWFDAELEELDGEQPERLSDADGVPITEVAKLNPDLILATNSGITQKDYDKLSKINGGTPVVAFPGDPWLTSWQDSLDLVGKALGRTAIAADVKEQTEAALAQAGEEHPQIGGKSFIFASLSTADMSKIDYYTVADNRPLILAETGMVNAPIIEELSAPGRFYGTLSADRAKELESDVFITYAETEDDLATFEQDPLLGQIPGIASGHVLASANQTDALGLSSPTPLSIPYAMEHFMPQVAKAVEGQ
ncbi:iron-siderophore ABC transporter substrate-binding protein [Nocardioides sp. JQ2195]|uniref:iron-siderophore ABC transporter substrate-binding protein n=1 Tax=Nocardioides sp. JQ2195 TaxID=2592334 RepID=UPI00143E9245|nr:iron-siderophore ABC transporter substrate-binding protein [Nocardioides sp. JQ2195]QIX25344.1 iron-siderophore ABC transporter substrate-binding protein [Nocardioides sp. JQ2195]